MVDAIFNFVNDAHFGLLANQLREDRNQSVNALPHLRNWQCLGKTKIDHQLVAIVAWVDSDLADSRIYFAQKRLNALLSIFAAHGRGE